MAFGGVGFSVFGMRWLRQIQDLSSTLSYMMPFLWLGTGAAMAGLHRSSKCFAEHGKSSPLVASAPVEVQPDELQLVRCSSRPPLRLYTWTLDLALATPAWG